MLAAGLWRHGVRNAINQFPTAFPLAIIRIGIIGAIIFRKSKSHERKFYPKIQLDRNPDVGIFSIKKGCQTAALSISRMIILICLSACFPKIEIARIRTVRREFFIPDSCLNLPYTIFNIQLGCRGGNHKSYIAYCLSQILLGKVADKRILLFKNLHSFSHSCSVCINAVNVRASA